MAGPARQQFAVTDDDAWRLRLDLSKDLALIPDK
jgi:hypothetical protein